MQVVVCQLQLVVVAKAAKDGPGGFVPAPLDEERVEEEEACGRDQAAQTAGPDGHCLGDPHLRTTLPCRETGCWGRELSVAAAGSGLLWQEGLIRLGSRAKRLSLRTGPPAICRRKCLCPFRAGEEHGAPMLVPFNVSPLSCTPSVVFFHTTIFTSSRAWGASGFPKQDFYLPKGRKPS